MISSILQWKHIRKLANIPPVSCSIRTKYLKCHFNCSFDLLYKLAVVCLSCYPITIYYLPINNCAVLPFLYYIREKRMEFKAFEHKKAHNFKLAPINFITIVLTLKWNEMKNFVIEFSQLLILFAQYLMCSCRVWLPYSANFIAMEIYLQRSNLGKAIINMHVNFKQKFKWFEHDQFQSTEYNQQLIISVSTIFPVHFVLLHKGFLWFLFILAFMFFKSNIWTLPNMFHHLQKAPSQSHKWSGNFYKYLENRIKCSTCNKVYLCATGACLQNNRYILWL